MNSRPVTRCNRHKVVYASREEAQKECNKPDCVHYAYHQCGVCDYCWYTKEYAEACCNKDFMEEILVNPPPYMV